MWYTPDFDSTPTMTITYTPSSSTTTSDQTALSTTSTVYVPTSGYCGLCGRQCGAQCQGWIVYRRGAEAQAKADLEFAKAVAAFNRRLLADLQANQRLWRRGRVDGRFPEIAKPVTWRAASDVLVPRARSVAGVRSHRPSHRRFVRT